MLDSHCGAARFAYNHMLAHVTAVAAQRAAERSYGLTEAELTPAQGLGDPNSGGTGTGTGSRPAANHRVGDGRGATQKTSAITTVVATAGGNETSTPHANKTGTAAPQGEAACA
jgi:hypothetical protein